MNTIFISESLQEIEIIKYYLTDKDNIENNQDADNFYNSRENANGDNSHSRPDLNNNINSFNDLPYPADSPAYPPFALDFQGDQQKTTISRVKIYFFRVFILAACFIISLSLKDFTKILSFSGSIFSPILSFFCPVNFKIY